MRSIHRRKDHTTTINTRVHADIHADRDINHDEDTHADNDLNAHPKIESSDIFAEAVQH